MILFLILIRNRQKDCTDFPFLTFFCCPLQGGNYSANHIKEYPAIKYVQILVIIQFPCANNKTPLETIGLGGSLKDTN